jgi:hypothetical protein
MVWIRPYRGMAGLCVRAVMLLPITEEAGMDVHEP